MCVLSAESRLKLVIGNYVVTLAQLEAQVETQQEQITKLTADLAAATPAVPGPRAVADSARQAG